MEIKKINFDNKEIKYISFGSGFKTMVIIPGVSLYFVSSSGDALEEAFKEFKKVYTIYLFDRNTFIPEGYTVLDFTNDLATAMKALNISNADIYATSQGAMMGMCLAIYYPELVDKMVLGSTAAKMTEESKAIMSNWIELIKAMKYKELNSSFWSYLFTPEYIEKYKELFEHINDNAKEEDYIRFIRQLEACKNIDLSDKLMLIRKPMFVMAAQNDQIFGPECFSELVNATGAVGYIFDNYYHAVYDEALEYKRYAYSFLVNGFKK